MVGVVAQYLELHPHASPSQVRQALLRDWATKNGVIGIDSPTTLLYTNASLVTPVELMPPASTASTGNSSLTVGAVVGIAVAASLGKFTPSLFLDEVPRSFHETMRVDDKQTYIWLYRWYCSCCSHSGYS